MRHIFSKVALGLGRQCRAYLTIILLALTQQYAWAQTPDPLTLSASVDASPGSYQFGVPMLKLDQAWRITKGRALISLADVGPMEHPDLQTGVGGNFRRHLSVDVQPLTGTNRAYHGMVVAGVMSARGFNGQGITGACPWCSFSYYSGPIDAGARYISSNDAGEVALNLSYGAPKSTPFSAIEISYRNCASATQFSDVNCNLFRRLALREIALVSVTQNFANQPIKDGDGVAFPGNHPDVIPVGGVQYDGKFWTQSYDEILPGSNWGPQLKLLAPSRDVMSLQLPGAYLYSYKPYRCGDRVNSIVSEEPTLPVSYAGYGNCMGTSFAAPWVTGIIGLMRSANPLLSNAEVKSLLYETATTPVAGPDNLTFYIPDAQKAVQRALDQGISAGNRNRLTPVFGLFTSGLNRHLFTTSPQAALSALSRSARYDSIGEAIPGYPTLIGKACTENLQSCERFTAKGLFSIFTTENAPDENTTLVPLHRLSIGQGAGRQMAYAAGVTQALEFERKGFNLDVVEGYVFDPAKPQPSGTLMLCMGLDSQRADRILYASARCDQTSITYNSAMTTGGNYQPEALLGYVYALQGVPSTAPADAGWWWRSDESGRGFFIEQRGNNMFISGYLYEADGRPTWFTASNIIKNGEFNAPIVTASKGQTLNGTYKAPTFNTTQQSITVKFNGQDEAQLQWPGGTTTISRFRFGGTGQFALPESGWWWAQSENGRGYSIEIQGDSIFFAGFMYNDDGDPVWYTASGKLIDGKTFTGPLYYSKNGQAISGAYKQPTTEPVGAITLKFDESTKGVLTLPNGTAVNITRYQF